MKKQVLTYLKPAKELTAGDRILTSRMAVAEIEQPHVSHDSTNRLCVHVFGKGVAPTGICFLADESVLVVE